MQNISLPLPPKSKELSEIKGVFEIAECYPGYGVTLGNALRRVLLASLEGAAITNVKIKDVAHEFSTIPFVMEDVIQIILNLKKIRFRMHKNDPAKAKLLVKGEKVVTASDIQTASDLEVINKDQIIANLTDKKAELEIEFTIEKGVGYQMAEERERKEKEIGTIEIDSLFSPVTRVNLEVENMRVGKRTDFEKLILTIETDGTINPEKALKDVAGVLVKQFSQIVSPVKAKDKTEISIVEEEKIIEMPQAEELEELIVGKRRRKKKTSYEKILAEMSDGDLLEMPVQKLKMPSRTANLLADQNFKTIGDLVTLSEEEILKTEGMGEKGLRDIKKALGNYGLVLENDEEKELKKKKKK